MNPHFDEDWAAYWAGRAKWDGRLNGSAKMGQRKPDYRKGAKATVDEIIARLDAYTVPSGDCLLWNANEDPDGYGWAYFPGWTNTTGGGAHVLAYAVYHGLSTPLGAHVDHECFNRLCCNPNHLRLLSPSENAATRRNVKAGDTVGRRQYRTEKARRAAKAAKAREIQEKLGITHLARRGAA